MSAAKHTPGPWTVGFKRKNKGSYPILAYKGNRMVCSGEEHPGQPIADVDTQANARLIAAAPELLESLIELEHVLGCMNEAGRCGWSAHLKHARAVIAKATWVTP